MAVQPGQKFDRYFIEELVGEGGMGRVYRAFDTRLERSVALKVLHAGGGDAAEAVAVALREARAAAAIAHPNATAIYDAHEVEGTSFIAMEFVAGTSLRALVGDAGVPLSTRLRWIIDVAAALAAAHKMGVVHRDVKPENVMVRNDGLVKVLDFGVARRIVIDSPLTAAGEPAFHASGARIAGTPAYMAPEQIRGEEIDGRADQFGWGVLAYELLTGHLPWRTAKDLVGFIAAIVTEDPAPPSELNREIPPAVDAAVLRALSKSPADRFPSILAAAAELARYARASLIMAVVTPSPVSVIMPPDSGPSGDPASDPTVAVSALDRGESPPPAAVLADVGSAPKPAVHDVGSAKPPAPPAPDGGTAREVEQPPAPRVAHGTLVVPARESPVPSSPRSAGRGQGEVSPSSSRPSPRGPYSSGPSAARPAVQRRRWPFGSGFHEPDFEAPIDLEAHLAMVPPDAWCKGLFINDTIAQASKVVPEQELFRLASLPERRYVGFRDYPLHESLRLTVAAARVLYPRYPLGEGLRRVGQTVFDALLTTHVGRSLFGVLGRDVELLLLAGPKAFKLLLSSGQITAEKTAFRTFVFHATGFPGFIETFQVGVLEGVLRYCGVRGRILVALEDLATATVELRLL